MDLYQQFMQWGPVVWLLQYEVVLWWIAATSLAVGIGTIVAAPWLVCMIREDYFATKELPPITARSRHPALRWTLRILANIAGILLIILGLIFGPLPGQGTLLALVGLLFLQFPGKRRLEMWLIRRPGLLKLINWLRAQRRRRPLRVWSPDSPSSDALESKTEHREKSHVTH